MPSQTWPPSALVQGTPEAAGVSEGAPLLQAPTKQEVTPPASGRLPLSMALVTPPSPSQTRSSQVPAT
jgi:hypothetical protein